MARWFSRSAWRLLPADVSIFRAVNCGGDSLLPVTKLLA
jgi:hypothetical protein